VQVTASCTRLSGAEHAMAMRTSGRILRRLPIALVCAILLTLIVSSGGVAQAHALPVRYSPAQNAVLRSPPTQVQIVFNEHVNPDISVLVVVNPSNQQVDTRDSQVSADGLSMTVSLPLLPAGTYVVFWRTHSADDGHVAAGSYLFHIARADGTVPPLTGKLPTGHFPGGAGIASINSINGPTLLGALARWFTLAALTLLLGMMFWSAVVQPRQRALSAPFEADVGQRTATVARGALLVILCATVLEVAAQAMLLDGSLAGVVSVPLLQSILLRSRFGGFLVLRAALVLVGLGVVSLASGREFDGKIRTLTTTAFMVALAIAYEFSGHGGSAPVVWGPSIDLLHLLANGIWLGGLFTLATVIVPTLQRLAPAERRAYLAASIPAFSVPALAAVAFVTLTGPLNATTRLTSVQQVWTTPYGLVLVAKSCLFLCMVAISYHHAFQLRPRLAASRASTSHPAGGTTGATLRSQQFPLVGDVVSRLLAVSHVPEPQSGPEGTLVLPSSGTLPPRTLMGGDEQQDILARAITRWLRVEATIGLGVLLCAALLGPLAGSLTPQMATTASFGAGGGAQTLTQKADALTVTLRVDPGKFGTNTFTVRVTNPDGSPASNGTVFLVTSMVEMDMGTNTINLTPSASTGTYSGQGELPMAGHWQLRTVIRTREDPTHLHTTTFTISASY
jgi:copper transport protein